MGGLPDVLVVIDTNKEHIAVTEARTLQIPVVAVLDSNSDPNGITYPVPGNDDAIRAIGLYCELFADAVLDGIQKEMTTSGADLGEAEEAPAEVLPDAAETVTAEAESEAAPEAPVEATPEATAEAAPEAPAEAAPEAPAEATPEAPAEPVAPVEDAEESKKDAPAAAAG